MLQYHMNDSLEHMHHKATPNKMYVAAKWIIGILRRLSTQNLDSVSQLLLIHQCICYRQCVESGVLYNDEAFYRITGRPDILLNAQAMCRMHEFRNIFHACNLLLLTINESIHNGRRGWWRRRSGWKGRYPHCSEWLLSWQLNVCWNDCCTDLHYQIAAVQEDSPASLDVSR